MARDLAQHDGSAEKDYALEFEEAAFLTLGVCYERNGRFAGGAYHPLLKRIDTFLGKPLAKALETRAERASAGPRARRGRLAAMKALKEKGFESPYLRAFVVARINPLRFQRGAKAEFDETIAKMLASARKFKADNVKPEQLARTGGAASEDVGSRHETHCTRLSAWSRAFRLRGRRRPEPRQGARPGDGEGRRPDARVRREDDLLADLAVRLRAEDARRRQDPGGLVLRVERLLHARARRHAPRRADPLRRRTA